LHPHPPLTACCPIECQSLSEVEPVPDYGSYHGEDAREAVWPLGAPSLEAQQHIHQQSRPELPADGLLGVAEEVADLQGLFDLFEEDLDRKRPSEDLS